VGGPGFAFETWVFRSRRDFAIRIAAGNDWNCCSLNFDTLAFDKFFRFKGAFDGTPHVVRNYPDFTGRVCG
jgi:hypothetical protein